MRELADRMRRDPKGPPYFDDLRTNGWTPRFHLLESRRECARAINVPHEDYPYRVTATLQALERTAEEAAEALRKGRKTFPDSAMASRIHRQIFPDHGPRAGQWRQVNVRVADHVPPYHELVPRLMEQLDLAYRDAAPTRDNLVAWATDFLTVHPFRDGNGRSSGVAVAAVHFAMTGRYLTPAQ